MKTWPASWYVSLMWRLHGVMRAFFPFFHYDLGFFSLTDVGKFDSACLLSNYFTFSKQTFVCRGDEAISKGMITTRFDCMIGMPHYFNYESRSDVDSVDLDRILNLKLSHHYRRIRQLFGSSNSESSDINRIDWNSPAGVAYKESLVLSPLAKRFAMTRVVHETDRVHLLYGFVCTFIGTELAIFLYKRSLRDMSPAERRLYKGRYLLATWALGFAVWFGVCKIRCACVKERGRGHTPTLQQETHTQTGTHRHMRKYSRTPKRAITHANTLTILPYIQKTRNDITERILNNSAMSMNRLFFFSSQEQLFGAHCRREGR